MEFKTAIIAIATACIVCSLASVGLTYKYTSQHYELQIKDEHLKQQTELAKVNAKVVAKERENNEITAKLENEAIANKDKVALLQASVAKYRNANGSLSVRSSSCNPSTAITSGTATSSVAASSTAPGGVCNIHGEFAEILSKTFSDADSMRGTLDVCRQYAETVEKQRKEMSNDNKQ